MKFLDRGSRDPFQVPAHREIFDLAAAYLPPVRQTDTLQSRQRNKTDQNADTDREILDSSGEIRNLIPNL